MAKNKKYSTSIGRRHRGRDTIVERAERLHYEASRRPSACAAASSVRAAMI